MFMLRQCVNDEFIEKEKLTSARGFNPDKNQEVHICLLYVNLDGLEHIAMQVR